MQVLSKLVHQERSDMSIIKSLSVGNGDMFYIKHDSDNFSIIDCCIDESNKEWIIKELKRESKKKIL